MLMPCHTQVKRAAVVDGDDVKSAEDPFSMEQFLQALKEEMEANAEFFGDTVRVIALM